MNADAVMLWSAVALYGLGLALTIPSVARRRPTLAPAALGALGLGLAFHLGWLLARAAEIHRLPISDVRSALSSFTFLATLAFFLVYLRYRIASLGLFMLPLVFLLTLLSALRAGRTFESPAFRSGWLLVHIASILIGYVGFFLTFVAALMYLIRSRELKSKNPQAFYFRLPPLDTCDQLYYRSLILGLPFLSLGILMGFVYASRTWTGPWELDPKILASLVTWLIYLVLFATRLSGNWGGRRSAALAIFGFAAVLVTFLGISMWSGLHGYFPNLGGSP
jgi:cytochrome c-type biogenesis protein CcsB